MESSPRDQLEGWVYHIGVQANPGHQVRRLPASDHGPRSPSLGHAAGMLTASGPPYSARLHPR